MRSGLPLKYAHVETLVAALLDLNVDHSTALNSRFKQLRRLSFPPVSSTGKAKFDYDLETVLITVIGFALLEALLLPQPMSELLPAKWPEIRREIARIIGRSSLDGPRVQAAREGSPFLAIEPHAHRRFTLPAGETEQEDRSGASAATLKLMTNEEIEAHIKEEGRPKRSLIVVDLFGHVLWTVESIVKARMASLEEVKAEAQGWR